MRNDFKAGDWIIREWLDGNGDVDVFQICNFKKGTIEVLKAKYFRNGKLLPYGMSQSSTTEVYYPNKRTKDRLAKPDEVPIQFRPKITITKQQKEQLIKTIKEI